MLVKNQVHTVTITDYNSEGFGVTRIDGQVVFVKEALLGETCSICILRVTKTHAFAKVIEVLEAAPNRQVPPCKTFGPCGGCDLLHMTYEEELSLKEKRVQSAFAKQCPNMPPLSPIIKANTRTHYRNKAIFAVSGEGLGFYRRRSHQVIATDNCLIQSPIANRAAATLYQWMTEFQIPAYEEASHSGTIRHLFVRTAKENTQGVICIVVTTANFPQKDSLINMLTKACPEALGILLCVNSKETNVVLDGNFHTLWGQDFLEEQLCGLHFRLSPKSFFQINPQQAEVLYDTALAFAKLTGEETVLDLYCGTGTITQIMAKGAKLAIGGEIVAAAISDAKENARQNGISNVEFIKGDATEITQILQERKLTIDVVIVDPPRKGLHETVVSQIGSMHPKRIVYVSCDPATLARDVRRFTEEGYTLKKVQPVDMFPCTVHVECVVLLERGEV